jgi:hypothetical protein
MIIRGAIIMAYGLCDACGEADDEARPTASMKRSVSSCSTGSRSVRSSVGSGA